jgi:Mg2+/citrate symporter
MFSALDAAMLWIYDSRAYCTPLAMQAMDEISAAGVQDEMSSPVLLVFSIHFVAVLGDDGFSINQ